MVIHSSFEDFILFLYVHISRADSHYDPAEIDLIQEKMKSLYPSETDFEKKLYGTLRQYNIFDKSRLPELFEETLKKFKPKKHSINEKLVADLLDIIHADGKVLPVETNTLNALKQIIDLYH